MPDALIGHTGFVGSNLAKQRPFDQYYNSRNIEDIRGKSFDLIVCAGVQSRKWWANLNPREDWAAIAKLLDSLRYVRAERFVLISTVDVHSIPADVDESCKPTTSNLNWYGTNRLLLEMYIEHQFPDCRIVRLPALFGPGLKKNALFDLMNDREVTKIPFNAEYQWYPVSHLWIDLPKLIELPSKVVNLVTEPIDMKVIAKRFFPNAKLGKPKWGAPKYDVRSLYGRGGYHLSASEVLREMREFVA